MTPTSYTKFQVAGLSLFDKSLKELHDTYIRTRVAVQEAMPDASALIGLQEVQCFYYQILDNELGMKCMQQSYSSEETSAALLAYCYCHN